MTTCRKIMDIKNGSVLGTFRRTSNDWPISYKALKGLSRECWTDNVVHSTNATAAFTDSLYHLNKDIIRLTKTLSESQILSTGVSLALVIIKFYALGQRNCNVWFFFLSTQFQYTVTFHLIWVWVTQICEHMDTQVCFFFYLSSLTTSTSTALSTRYTGFI
jgi:hypothetical protein